jgi:hypothetical protein
MRENWNRWYTLCNLMRALLEVFYQPGKVFESLPGRRGAWIIPMILNALLLVAITAVTPHYIGRENLMRQQLENFHLSPEAMQKALESAHNPAAIYRGYIFAAIGVCVVLMIIAGALTAFGMMTSSPPRFQTMLSMVSIAYFPYYLIVACMTTLVLMASPDPTTLNASNLVGTNPAAYVDKNMVSKGLYSVLSSLDILSFAEIALLALGFSKLTKSGLPGGLAAVGALWILYVSVKMGISLLF